MDTVRAFLISSSCLEIFYRKATLIAIYTINRIPSPVIGNVSPFEHLRNCPPNYQMLKFFGCANFVLFQPLEYIKLEPRYGIKHKGYHCWDSSFQTPSNLSSCHILEIQNVINPIFLLSDQNSHSLFTNPNASLFPNDILGNDSSFSLSQSTTRPAESPLAVEPDDSSSVILSLSPVSHPLPLRHIYRVSQASILLRDYVCNSSIVTYESRMYHETSSNLPWQKAMTEELQALIGTHTWDLVDLPPDKFVVGCK